jgi:hypothetical protein
MEKNSHCLYRHLKPNGEIFYIGIGKDLKRAYNKYNRTTLWTRVVDKHGYEVQILKTKLSKDEACELEKTLISWYGRIDLGTGVLVNMTDGGDGTSNKSPETRNKISESQKGELNHMFGKFGELNGNFGKRWSDEKRQMASELAKKRYKENPHLVENMKLRKASDETKRKISENANKPCGCNHRESKEVINLQTGIIHCSSREAADTYGFKRTTLKAMLNGSNPNRTDLRYLENLQ